MMYLASPYTDKDPEVMQERYNEVAKYCAFHLVDTDIVSPICHWHPIAAEYDLPRDHLTWRRWNRMLLEKCSTMGVFMLEGWHLSDGVRDEICFASTKGIPIVFIDPTEEEKNVRNSR